MTSSMSDPTSSSRYRLDLFKEAGDIDTPKQREEDRKFGTVKTYPSLIGKILGWMGKATNIEVGGRTHYINIKSAFNRTEAKGDKSFIVLSKAEKAKQFVLKDIKNKLTSRIDKLITDKGENWAEEVVQLMLDKWNHRSPTEWKETLKRLNNEMENGLHSESLHQIFDEKAKNSDSPLATYLKGYCLLKGFFNNQDIEDIDDTKAEAEKLLDHAAYEGNLADAQYELGVLISNSGIGENYSEAVSLFEKAAHQGYVEAQYSLGEIYAKGIHTKRNIPKAIEWLKKAANAGNIDALVDLGVLYSQDKSSEKNQRLAFDLFQKATNAGHVLGMCNLGTCYQDGIGTEKDDKKAFGLFERAAGTGNLLCQIELGRCYRDGIGTDKNPQKAFELINSAVKGFERALQNNPDEVFGYALYQLGICYRDGIGVGENKDKAFRLFKQAAKKGSAEGQYDLGRHFAQERPGNFDRAVHWYVRAVDQGNLEAKNQLALCYMHGHGVEKDSNHAFILFKQAAEEGLAVACFNMGMCYLNGEGVNKDPGMAFDCFKQAAEAGDLDAQIYTGLCYLEGFGVRQDLKKAAQWLEKAGDFEKSFSPDNIKHRAKNALGVAYLMGRGLDQDLNKAIPLLKEAANNGDRYAQFNLGLCYLNGKGVEKNLTTAVKYFRELTQGEDTTEESTKHAPSLHAEAWFCIGRCYKQGDTNLPRDDKEAHQCFEKAASLGSKKGKFMVLLAKLLRKKYAKSSEALAE